MAIPGAVQRRAEREASELRAQGIDPTSGEPIEAQIDPSATPGSTPAPVPSTPVDPRDAKIAELEAALSTQNGRASTSSQELQELKRQFDAVNGNRTFLETKLTELTEKVGQLEQEKTTLQQRQTTDSLTAVVSSLDERGPTEKQIEVFGQESVDFVESVVKRAVAAIIKPLVARLSDMETTLARVREIDGKIPKLESAANVSFIEAARSREQDFFTREILPNFPDFVQVRGTPEWQKYLLEDVPGRGYKIGELLKTHRDSANAAGIRAVIGAYYDRKKATPSLDSLAVPAKTGADAPLQPEAKKMKASEYKRMLQQFTFKKISKADWEAFRTRWDAAISSGNVEMDEEIR
jgi:hypothetical protein